MNGYNDKRMHPAANEKIFRLPKTRVWASNFAAQPLISASSWLSSTLQWGCDYSCDRTASGKLDQRFYNNVYGRFMTADPYKQSGGPGDPLLRRRQRLDLFQPPQHLSVILSIVPRLVFRRPEQFIQTDVEGACEAHGHIGGEFSFVAFERRHDGLDKPDLLRQLDLSKSAFFADACDAPADALAAQVERGEVEV